MLVFRLMVFFLCSYRFSLPQSSFIWLVRSYGCYSPVANPRNFPGEIRNHVLLFCCNLYIWLCFGASPYKESRRLLDFEKDKLTGLLQKLIEVCRILWHPSNFILQRGGCEENLCDIVSVECSVAYMCILSSCICLGERMLFGENINLL